MSHTIVASTSTAAANEPPNNQIVRDRIVSRSNSTSRCTGLPAWLFGGSFAAAVLVLATIVWLTVRRGKRLAKRSSPSL